MTRNALLVYLAVPRRPRDVRDWGLRSGLTEDGAMRLLTAAVDAGEAVRMGHASRPRYAARGVALRPFAEPPGVTRSRARRAAGAG